MLRVVVLGMLFDGVPAHPCDKTPLMTLYGLNNVASRHAHAALDLGDDGRPELPCIVPCPVSPNIDGRSRKGCSSTECLAPRRVLDQKRVSNHWLAFGDRTEFLL